MKREWLYVGAVLAALSQSIFHWLWIDFFFAGIYTNLQPEQFTLPELPYTLISEVAFALIVAFLYLHIPDGKRSLKSGATIGSILGLLIGIYQSLHTHALLHPSLSAGSLETIESLLLGAISGLAISFAEITFNRRIKTAGL